MILPDRPVAFVAADPPPRGQTFPRQSRRAARRRALARRRAASQEVIKYFLRGSNYFMDTFSRKEQILKFGTIKQLTFFGLAPVFFSPGAMFCRRSGAFF